MAQYARKNMYRMPSYYDLDDLIQDGYWVWYQLLSRPRYAVLTDKPQVMNLFKMAYASWIHHLSKETQCKMRKGGEPWTAQHFAQQYDMEPEEFENLRDDDLSEEDATIPLKDVALDEPTGVVGRTPRELTKARKARIAATQKLARERGVRTKEKKFDLIDILVESMFGSMEPNEKKLKKRRKHADNHYASLRIFQRPLATGSS